MSVNDPIPPTQASAQQNTGYFQPGPTTTANVLRIQELERRVSGLEESLRRAQYPYYFPSYQQPYVPWWQQNQIWC